MHPKNFISLLHFLCVQHSSDLTKQEQAGVNLTLYYTLTEDNSMWNFVVVVLTKQTEPQEEERVLSELTAYVNIKLDKMT